ncbi:MAG TPA: hypothetical protein VEP50_00095 [bacterium]|nr:hypothetical protein [bacterium]
MHKVLVLAILGLVTALAPVADMAQTLQPSQGLEQITDPPAYLQGNAQGDGNGQ